MLKKYTMEKNKKSGGIRGSLQKKIELPLDVFVKYNYNVYKNIIIMYITSI